jgi:hypothetical protein
MRSNAYGFNEAKSVGFEWDMTRQIHRVMENSQDVDALVISHMANDEMPTSTIPARRERFAIQLKFLRVRGCPAPHAKSLKF